ncbi:MAG: BamA/TamA family outer membrane protein, partial [Minicystis sp.]
RRPRPAPGSGARVELAAEYGANLRDPRASGWARYGGTVGGFVDLTGTNRVLSLSATALFADPLGQGEIPFTELVQLGGTNPMGGFYQGRLTGRSAAVVALEYRYPIWAFLDASAQLAIGNVFDVHLAGLTPENQRLSFAFGLRSAGERDHSFNILFGGGTETFGQGGHISELRFLIGATQGF